VGSRCSTSSINTKPPVKKTKQNKQNKFIDTDDLKLLDRVMCYFIFTI